jgi:hypothetical protein
MSFNQPIPPAAILNYMFYENIWAPRADETGRTSFLGKQRSKFSKKDRETSVRRRHRRRLTSSWGGGRFVGLGNALVFACRK